MNVGELSVTLSPDEVRQALADHLSKKIKSGISVLPENVTLVAVEGGFEALIKINGERLVFAQGGGGVLA